ncbi:TBC1D4 [Cordylochernes scorpioides]|uniref:TBC1D4 n=1 Tax=Cordylochernes scorpioides TaxID=51811 RepID=A0ABY6JV87_9ARAC|nr:TBC1D4 [Cordylochernes scorpioides]
MCAMQVYTKRAPPVFIDEAVEKLRRLEELQEEPRQRHGSGSSVASLPNCLDSIPPPQENLLAQQLGSDDSSAENIPPSELLDVWQGEMSDPFDKSPISPGMEFGQSLISHTQSMDSTARQALLHDLQEMREPLSPTDGTRIRSFSGDTHRPVKQLSLPPYRTRALSGDMKKSPTEPSRSNRIMLFLIGQLELCMISPDRKQVLLSKTFNDISHCSKGIEKRDHFGFICREMSASTGSDNYIAYIFRGQTEKVNVFQSHIIRHIFYHFTSHNVLLLHLVNPPVVVEVDELMNALKQAFQNAHHVYQRNIQRLRTVCDTCPMTWFHRLCLELEGNTPDKCQSIIMNKISHLAPADQEIIMERFQGAEVTTYEEQNEVFMMLIRSLCEQKQSKHSHSGTKTELSMDKKIVVPSKLNSLKQKAKKSLSNSFETILKTSVGLVLDQCRPQWALSLTSVDLKSSGDTPDSAQPPKPVQPRSRAELRALWKKAIMEQILLIRMDRENKKLQMSQDAASHKRMRLDYEEIPPCLKEAALRWDHVLEEFNQTRRLLEKSSLHKLVKDGVPRHKRGAIWQFLVDHYCQQHLGSPTEEIVELTGSYQAHLTELTPNQHAILIDLGRTFPSHPYFSQPLGAGQLALFNLLKAYSLLDQEVGYCQGLSFVAGVLLLHSINVQMPEEQAFEMLKHIQYRLGFRRQYKQPDMIALHIQMYQLSRLLHDFHPDLYNHFDTHEISPTLYAAPWFLTFFASQFPLGFVARLFDLVLLQGIDAIFKVSLALLGCHKEVLLQCQSFESIMECIKSVLPAVDIIRMEHIFNQAFSLHLSRNLHAYEVEYHVLQEEVMCQPPPSRDSDKIKSLEASNTALKSHNMELLEQLQWSLRHQDGVTTPEWVQVAHNTIHQLEHSMGSYQSSLRTLEARIKSLEEERDALMQTVTALRQAQS